MTERFKDHLKLHLVVLIWGYTGIIGKWVTLQADQLVLIRMASAFLILALFLRRKLFRVPPAFALRFCGVGIIIAAHWVTFFAAIKAANVSVALACMASTSIFAAFIEPLFYNRKVALNEVLTSLIGFVGVFFIFGISTEYETGILLALLSSLLAALFAVLNGYLFKQNKQTWDLDNGGATEMTCFEMLGGLVALVLYEMIWGAPLSTWLLDINNISLAILLGVLCTAIPFVVSIQVMRNLSPFTTCLTVNLEPVYAIILALWHFGENEQMTMGFYLATLLILCSVFINSFIQTAPPSAPVS